MNLQSEDAEKSIEEVARELGVSLEFLERQPPWFQEGRAPSAEEYTDWSRSQKGACQEYAPVWPLSRYQGVCSHYKRLGNHHCGVPFVSKLNCRTGMVDEGKSKSLTQKDMRKSLHSSGGRLDSEGKLVSSNREQSTKKQEAGTRGVIIYVCEECGSSFESGRTRKGPLYCGPCAGILRREGRGAGQLKRGL